MFNCICCNKKKSNKTVVNPSKESNGTNTASNTQVNQVIINIPNSNQSYIPESVYNQIAFATTQVNYHIPNVIRDSQRHYYSESTVQKPKPITVPNKVITIEILQLIANTINSEGYNNLIKMLNLPQEEVIPYTSSCNRQEYKKKLLNYFKLWKEREGTEATVKKFAFILVKSKYIETAMSLSIENYDDTQRMAEQLYPHLLEPPLYTSNEDITFQNTSNEILDITKISTK